MGNSFDFGVFSVSDYLKEQLIITSLAKLKNN